MTCPYARNGPCQSARTRFTIYVTALAVLMFACVVLNTSITDRKSLTVAAWSTVLAATIDANASDAPTK